MDLVIVIVILACAFMGLLIGIIVYCYRRNIRNMCGRTFHRKKRVHEITAPVRPSGENEIVLAVTQRREPSLRNHTPLTHGTSLGRHNTVVGDGTYQRHTQRPPPPYLVGRHQSFSIYQTGGIGARRTHHHLGLGSGSDLPSPLVSNLSSLQSLLMSSQVAIFDSSTERLSLSSQTNNHHNNNLTLVQHPHQHQPISIPLRQLQIPQNQNHAIPPGHGLSSSSPLTVSPAASNFSVHLPQPSYSDERPPSYQESIQKLRASDRGVGRIPGHSTNGIDLSRRSCRM